MHREAHTSTLLLIFHRASFAFPACLFKRFLRFKKTNKMNEIPLYVSVAGDPSVV